MTENVVLEILRVIQADVSGLKTDLAAVKTSLAAVKTDLAAVKTDVAAVQSDLTTVKTDVHSHTRLLDVLQQDTALIRGARTGRPRTPDILLRDARLRRGAVNDMAKESVTPGEVEAIHHDLNRLQQQVSELTARLIIVEGCERH